MSLSPGTLVELDIEKPVAGGRMLARHEGEVVLVSGAIPGERVRARIEKRQQGVVLASTAGVLEPSPDRREPPGDPACGGMTYAHIAYPRQLALKAAVIADALRRIARLERGEPVPVRPSPEHGYRLRARVHSDGRQLGFFAEGTHRVCDPGPTGQLLGQTLAVLRDLAARLPAEDVEAVEAFELAENLPASERVVHVAVRPGREPEPRLLLAVAGTPGVSGVSWGTRGRSRVTAVSGRPWVSDPLPRLLGARLPAPDTAGEVPVLKRHAPAFFQANRFLIPALVQEVCAAVRGGVVVDLYAGVGLFAVSLAASGCDRVIAVEGDALSARDLADNARPFAGRLAVAHQAVEAYLAGARLDSDATIIVDPPRTGISRAAMQAVLAVRARRIVYVSCDVATMARDARRLVDTGYTLGHLAGLDLFPNTPHVEVLGVFDRG
jgi:23S rRNA (uracil1939-C5)-methyltransferase